MSDMPTNRGLNAVLTFAARKALPSATVSSPFRCMSRMSRFRPSFSTFWKTGTRMLPPITSTACRSSYA